MTAPTDTAQGVVQTSAALDRIHRLEFQERQRLERDMAKADRRADATAQAQPPDPRRERVERLEHHVRLPMVAVGVAWAVIVVIVLTSHTHGTVPQATVGALFAVWLVVVAETTLRYVLSPDRKGYLASRKIEPVMVAVPLLQVVRLAGVERVSVISAEVMEGFLAILKHRGLFRVLLAALGLVILGAWLVLLFEDKAPGSNIHSFWDAIWWAVVTVTTVGYGDRFPVSEGGRIVAMALMFVGIGLIGTLTATVASFFVQEHTDANKAQLAAAHEDLGAKLDDIDARLARMETLLGAAPAAAPAGTPAGAGPGVSAENGDPSPPT